MRRPIMLCAPTSPRMVAALLTRVGEETSVAWGSGESPTPDNAEAEVLTDARSLHVAVNDPDGTWHEGRLWWDQQSPELSHPIDNEKILMVSPWIFILELRRQFPR